MATPKSSPSSDDQDTPQFPGSCCHLPPRCRTSGTPPHSDTLPQSPGWDRGGGIAGGTGRGCHPRQEAASARYATLIAAAGSAGDASRAPRPHARGRYSGTRNYRHRRAPGQSTARYRRHPPSRAQRCRPAMPQKHQRSQKLRVMPMAKSRPRAGGEPPESPPSRSQG